MIYIQKLHNLSSLQVPRYSLLVVIQAYELFFYCDQCLSKHQGIFRRQIVGIYRSYFQLTYLFPFEYHIFLFFLLVNQRALDHILEFQIHVEGTLDQFLQNIGCMDRKDVMS